MTDLDEIRRRSARLREIERQDAKWQRRPFLVRWLISEYWILVYTIRFIVVPRMLHVVRVWIPLRYVHARECARDRWLVARGRPLYFRCFNYTNTWRPCRNDATWTYVGTQVDGSPTLPPHHPIQCDACMREESPEMPDYMKRVGRWHRAPTYVSDVAVRGSLVRPE